MPNPPPRARFQIHLSTAIVLMFAAGGLLWVNMREQIITRNPRVRGGNLILQFEQKCHVYGWPWVAIETKLSFGGFGYTPDLKPELKTEISPMITINLAIAFSILFSVWYACEWIIRRRLLKKGT